MIEISEIKEDLEKLLLDCDIDNDLIYENINNILNKYSDITYTYSINNRDGWKEIIFDIKSSDGREFNLMYFIKPVK